jgi:hypothetical protein
VARLVCIGLDLAWSARNPSGVATLEVEIRDPAIQNLTGYLLDSRLLGTNEEIVTTSKPKLEGIPAWWQWMPPCAFLT